MVTLSWPLPRLEEVRLAAIRLMHEHKRKVFAAQLTVNLLLWLSNDTVYNQVALVLLSYC